MPSSHLEERPRANRREFAIEPNLQIPNKEPVNAVGINWEDPITKDLACSFVFNNGLANNLTKRNYFFNDGVRTVVTPFGKAAKIDTAAPKIRTENVTQNDLLSGVPNQEISVYVFMQIADVATETVFTRVIDKANASVSGGGYGIYLTGGVAGTNSLYGTYVNGVYQGNAPQNFDPLEYQGFGCSLRAGQFGRYFKNGVFGLGDRNISAFPTATANFDLLGNAVAGGQGITRPLVTVHVWGRFLSDLEHKLIHQNRYRFLKTAL